MDTTTPASGSACCGELCGRLMEYRERESMAADEARQVGAVEPAAYHQGRSDAFDRALDLLREAA
jgi:hypothetical protein